MNTNDDDDTLTEAQKQKLIEDFATTETAHDVAKANYLSARKGLLSLLPKAIGEFEIKVGRYTLNIKYPEKADWNTLELEALYGADKPLHVKASYSIDMRVLRSLPDAEREALEKCYEIKPGTPVINLEKN